MSTLYIIGTPIGNLGDIGPRALEVLGQVDFIAAEDTRVSMKLLNHFGIKKPMIRYYQHNSRERGEQILRRIQAGESCAVITDAGMPCISDPGEDLVKLCASAGVPVASIPGCCALVSALAVSGLAAGRFTFEGFLSVNKKSRREHLQSLLTERRTMIFYEAPHKLRATLEDLHAAFGDRPVALCRELTELHEEVRRTTLAQAEAYYREVEPRGEFVLVVAGGPEPASPELSLEEAVELVLERREAGLRMKEAVGQVAEAAGLSRNRLYEAALEAERERE